MDRSPTNSEKFWDFSFSDVAYQDIPAVYKFILKITKKNKLVYFGYGLGCTEIFAAMADKRISKWVQKRTQKVIALAPLIYPSFDQDSVYRTWANY